MDTKNSVRFDYDEEFNVPVKIGLRWKTYRSAKVWIRKAKLLHGGEGEETTFAVFFQFPLGRTNRSGSLAMLFAVEPVLYLRTPYRWYHHHPLFE